MAQDAGQKMPLAEALSGADGSATFPNDVVAAPPEGKCRSKKIAEDKVGKVDRAMTVRSSTAITTQGGC
ncbi:hypothetical protein [Mycolicibacterium sarraceniae]|uniref:hypothetical protein n=1 Tax=Mycolicibacterium sarraceniae TaxID=1534348 RepID=UPI0013D10FEC|nr:hypothetical protein [Mycolicibacterium sarraceniae]